MSQWELSLQISPWLFKIDDLEQHHCEYDEYGQFTYPDFLPLNFQSLSYDSVYLMNDGFDLMMYVGSDVHANLLNKLFGVSTIDQIYNGYPEESMFPNYEDPLCMKIYNLLTEMRYKKTTRHQNLVVIVSGRGTQAEITFFYRLYEEKYNGYTGGYYHSYDEFYNNFVSSQYQPQPVRN